MPKKSILLTLLLVIAFQVSCIAQEVAEQLNWYKGNLHTHSLWSDGNDFPEMITKWYADNDYHFLAMTDHNILSEGEKWMSVEAIKKRGGKTAVAKCEEAFGADWLETRTNEKSGEQVRLKTLSEYRGKFEQEGTFLLMTGEEISDSVDGLPIHMNATNLSRLLRPAGGETVRDAINNNMRAAIEQAKQEDREILVHLNHPNFGWAITAEDLAFVTLEKFFEIFNGHPSVNQKGDRIHPSLDRLWDIANTIRIAQLDEAPLFGIGTDDSHNYHGKPNGASPGRGWIMVQAASLSPNTLIQAINRGEFYSSSGVTLNSITFDKEARSLSLEIEPVEGETYTTQFIGTNKDYDAKTEDVMDSNGNVVRTTKIYSDDVGSVLAEVPGNNPTYELTGNELYVRAKVISSADHPNPSFEEQKKQAWTQPVGWRE